VQNLKIARTKQDEGCPDKADARTDHVPLIGVRLLDDPKPKQRRQNVNSPISSVEARPAAAASMRVSATAKMTCETIPARVQSGLLPSRSYAQNEKEPAISPAATSKYQSKDLI
jgi:hypothetical protein